MQPSLTVEVSDVEFQLDSTCLFHFALASQILSLDHKSRRQLCSV